MEQSDINYQREFIPRSGQKDFEEIRRPFGMRNFYLKGHRAALGALPMI